jgi:hypothetical protein
MTESESTISSTPAPFTCACGDGCACNGKSDLSVGSLYSLTNRAEAEAFWEDLGRPDTLTVEQQQDKMMNAMFGLEDNSLERTDD